MCYEMGQLEKRNSGIKLRRSSELAQAKYMMSEQRPVHAHACTLTTISGEPNQFEAFLELLRRRVFDGFECPTKDFIFGPESNHLIFGGYGGRHSHILHIHCSRQLLWFGLNRRLCLRDRDFPCASIVARGSEERLYVRLPTNDDKGE